MSEVTKEREVYLRFRDENEPMPVATDLEQVGVIIEERVKPGLGELCRVSDLTLVEYAGFALSSYTYPQDRFEFRFPELIQALRRDLTGIGIHVGDILPEHPQDFWLSSSDCFDIRAISHRYPILFQEGVYPQRDIEGVSSGYGSGAHVLGPVVRYYVDGLGDNDELYNQPNYMAFSTRWSVFIPEHVILEGLITAYPDIAEGYAIPSGLPSKYLAERFGLKPADNTYEDWYEGLRRYENSPPDSYRYMS